MEKNEEVSEGFENKERIHLLLTIIVNFSDVTNIHVKFKVAIYFSFFLELQYFKSL